MRTLDYFKGVIDSAIHIETEFEPIDDSLEFEWMVQEHNTDQWRVTLSWIEGYVPNSKGVFSIENSKMRYGFNIMNFDKDFAFKEVIEKIRESVCDIHKLPLPTFITDEYSDDKYESKRDDK